METVKVKIVSNYGTFEVSRVVEIEVDTEGLTAEERADEIEDAAYEETGIMSILIAAGYTVEESPEGEDHEIIEITTGLAI